MAEFPYAWVQTIIIQMMKVEIDEKLMKSIIIKRRFLEQQVTTNWLKFMAKSIN
jgi:hypothetical protein